MSNRAIPFLACFLWLFNLSVPALAHNLNFGTLTLIQSSAEDRQLSLVFQISGDQGKHLDSRVEPPARCEVQSEAIEEKNELRMRIRQLLRCEEPGLEGKTVRFSQLPSGANILVRALRGEVVMEERLLEGEVVAWEVRSGSAAGAGPFFEYVGLGIEHILMGWDHLLFLLMLMLLVPVGMKLVPVITSFTLGHSITLALATLGLIQVPIQPTEALIALSILFLASEVIRYQRDRSETLTLRYPGIVTALFGLFHGLGFASVLGDIGVPEDQVVTSLVAFNVGVELGQLGFVGVIVVLGRLLRRLPSRFDAERAIAYAGGSLGAFWLIERVVGF